MLHHRLYHFFVFLELLNKRNFVVPQFLNDHLNQALALSKLRTLRFNNFGLVDGLSSDVRV